MGGTFILPLLVFVDAIALAIMVIIAIIMIPTTNGASEWLETAIAIRTIMGKTMNLGLRP